MCPAARLANPTLLVGELIDPMSTEEYLALLRQRLRASYEVAAPPQLPGSPYALYARSRLVAGKYILHRSITYERVEVNEHVLCRVSPGQTTPTEVKQFVADLKESVKSLVQPSHEHMASAIGGVLISEGGFAQDAAREITRAGFTVNFRLGFYGWCFLRLIAVDLAAERAWANRRGKEVLKAYDPGQAGPLL